MAGHKYMKHKYLTVTCVQRHTIGITTQQFIGRCFLMLSVPHALYLTILSVLQASHLCSEGKFATVLGQIMNFSMLETTDYYTLRSTIKLFVNM
jgi:hypothetical protein